MKSLFDIRDKVIVVTGGGGILCGEMARALARAGAKGAVPELFDIRVEIGIVAIVLIMLANLRGLRESGNIFAIPTYLFVGMSLLLIAIGPFRIVVLGDGAPAASPLPGAPDPLQAIVRGMDVPGDYIQCRG
mgnify:CR=1 FL=1